METSNKYSGLFAVHIGSNSPTNRSMYTSERVKKYLKRSNETMCDDIREVMKLFT